MDKDFVLPLDRAQVVREGTDVTITAFSRMVSRAPPLVRARAREYEC